MGRVGKSGKRVGNGLVELMNENQGTTVLDVEEAFLPFFAFLKKAKPLLFPRGVIGLLSSTTKIYVIEFHMTPSNTPYTRYLLLGVRWILSEMFVRSFVRSSVVTPFRTSVFPPQPEEETSFSGFDSQPNHDDGKSQLTATA